MIHHPKGWKIKSLEEVAEVRTGLAKGKLGQKDPITLPYLRVANVQDGHIDLREIKTIQVARAEVERYRLKTGDVLLTEGGDLDKLGRGHIWEGQIDPCLHQNHVFAVRTKSEVLKPEFLALLTTSSHGRFYFLCCAKRTTNLASVNSTQVRQFPVLLPTIPEQEKLCELLGSWKITITKLAARLDLAEERKRGLMQQLLTGRKRFNEFKCERWRHCRLGDIVQTVSRPVTWDENELYRLAIVRRWNGGVDLRESLHGHEIKVKKLQTIHAGDFLVSHIQAAYGAMAVVPARFEGAKVSELYTILRPKNPKEFDLRFLGYLGETKRMWYMAIQASNGFFAERLRLNFDPDEFLHLPVSIPPTFAEQKKIADTLETCDREIDLLQKQLAALKEQKRGLMQKLLTGEVTVKAEKQKSQSKQQKRRAVEIGK